MLGCGCRGAPAKGPLTRFGTTDGDGLTRCGGLPAPGRAGGILTFSATENSMNDNLCRKIKLFILFLSFLQRQKKKDKTSLMDHYPVIIVLPFISKTTKRVFNNFRSF